LRRKEEDQENLFHHIGMVLAAKLTPPAYTER
jgi:hypothetical protein